MLKQRILVVDDDREVVRLMQAYLERAGYEVMIAYDGQSAVHMLRREKPDLLLLDLMLPDQDGFDITRLMRGDPTLADIPIIMLTARVDVTDRIVGLEMGADDYVTKPYDPREVVARVRARLRSPGPLQPQIYESGDLQLDIGRREVRVGDNLVDLTPTEFNLLRVLMSQAGYVLTRSELISRGLGADYEGIERTLDSHIRNLRQKIERDPEKVKYIHTIYGVGYRLEEIRQ
jgi:two-component system alkaline phosphatase synthesis response regulator PhoP